MFSPARLDRLNASLTEAPYKGLSVACPSTPVLADRSVEGAQPFARFLIETLLPRMRRETGSTADRAGLKVGDVIVEVDGINDPTSAQLQQSAADGQLLLRLRRRDSQFYAALKK